MVAIKDVAALAGVSTATVSRTLSQPDKVSEKTRERVMKAVEKSGYRFNAAARQFRRQRTETILTLVPDIGNPFFSNIVQGIESAAQASGYRVVLGETNPELSTEGTYAGYMQQRHADGAILLGVDGADSFANEDSSMPVVMACEHLPRSPFPTVRINNARAAQEAVAYLIELGHRRIAYINGPPDSPISKDRLRGYRKAMKQAGLKIDDNWIAPGDYSPASGYHAAKALLQMKKPPTAIFAISDPMAIGAMRAASELGVKIPQDLSLVGFDDIRFAEFMTPRLTTVHQHRELIGQVAMEMLVRLLDGEKVAQETILDHELVIRESTGKPRDGK